MLKLNLDDVLINKDILMEKHIDTLNFREIICLIFHAIKTIKEEANITNDEWIQFYKDFEINLEIQNNKYWPKLSLMENKFRKRLEIFSPSLYNSTKNLLILILRLLYVENHKSKYLTDNTDFHEILTHKISIPDKYACSKVSLVRLFEIFKIYMQYYIMIYSNEMMYENILGKSIMEQL
jgi:hypothetical protein